jgi:hypothetical protein
MTNSILKNGAYSCRVDFLPKTAPPSDHHKNWLCCHFTISGVYGLDVESKFFKTEKGAKNYGSRILEKFALNTEKAAKL